MQRRTFTKLFSAVLVSAVAVAGCGGASSESGATPGTRTITSQQYRLLREVHMELGQFIDEANQSIQPTAYSAESGLQSQSLSQRAGRLRAVFEKYGDELPRPPSLSGEKMTPQEAAGLKGTLTGSMLELYQPTSESESLAGSVAYQYLRPLDEVYGLNYFESYLLRHTKDEGATINQDDPPDQMDPSSETKGFSSVGVNISLDPSSGRITYQLGPNKSVTSPIQMSIPELEQRFIIEARDNFQVGDGALIESFKS